MGFDLTDPANQDEMRSFSIDYTRISWSQSIGLTKPLNDKAIVEIIVDRFPDVEFYMEECRDGQPCLAYLKGDIYEEIHMEMYLDVGVDNPESYARLAETFPEQQSLPFFIFPLGDITFREANAESVRILNRISEILPGEKLHCILVEEEKEEGALCYWKKCVTSNGKPDWQEVSSREQKALEKATDYNPDVCWSNKPNGDVFKCLFVDSYQEEIDRKAQDPVGKDELPD